MWSNRHAEPRYHDQGREAPGWRPESKGQVGRNGNGETYLRRFSQTLAIWRAIEKLKFQLFLVSCIPNSLQFAAWDFRLPRGDERRAYPQRSVRSEQRSGSRKELRPFGLRLKCPRASLLVGHRPLSGMLPPRASPRGILGATNCKLFGIHDTSSMAPRRSGFRDRKGLVG